MKNEIKLKKTKKWRYYKKVKEKYQNKKQIEEEINGS